jgi:hemoglobin
MRRTFLAILIATTFASQAARAADDGLYRAFGEKAGISSLMADFVTRLKADTRIGVFFKDTNAVHLAQQLSDQVCQIAGGPCIYDGPSMRVAHRELDIDRAAFNRLVELLQDAMNARGIAFGTQNALLARLAPMHRDIITPPEDRASR